MAFQSTKGILDTHMFFEQASEFERVKLQILEAAVNLFETDVLLSRR